MSHWDFVSILVELYPPRVYVSRTGAVAGPWIPILDEELEDSRQMADPLPLQTFLLSKTTTSQYVKFELLSWWGQGGGLQYFDIQRHGEPHFFH